MIKTIVTYVIIFLCLYGAIVLTYHQLSKSLIDDVSQRIISGQRVMMNDQANKIEAIGHSLNDSLKTYVDGTRYLTNPGFFERLLSKNAREQKHVYDSVLSLIPESVRQEFDRTNQKPVEVGTTTLTLDSVLIEVKIGNSVKFSRGSLSYNKEHNSYVLNLYKDEIELTEVRGEIQDDGFLLSTITAHSKLTGQYINVSSTKNFISWPTTPVLDWHPYIGLDGGVSWGYDGKLAPTANLRAEWIKLHINKIQWDVFKTELTPQGLFAKTGVTYKF